MKKIFLLLFLTILFENHSNAFEIYSWGRNDHGQLGDGTQVEKNSPVRIGSDNDWISAKCGGVHTIALKTNGTLWAWGRNNFGQLGDGTTTSRTSPVQIGFATNWSYIACGYNFTLAIKTDGTLWAWGDNEYGQLGDGTTTSRTYPVQIGTATNWATVSAGEFHTVAVKRDGTIWAWGSNSYGQLGDGTTISRTSPVRIGTANDWINTSCGRSFTLALKAERSLWAWGYNNYGQLGDGTTTQRNSPIQIGTATNWGSISTGYVHSASVKNNDLTIWTWGENYYGQLGDGTYNDRTIPLQVNAATNWSFSVCGSRHTVAKKENGTIWACGSNYYGQLGDGTNNNRNTFVQIGTETTWRYLSCGFHHTIALKTASPSNTIITGTISGSPFCPGSTISVPYTATGNYISGNVFTAQLSNSSGSFAEPTNIGTIVATVSGTITCIIPSTTATGSGYRIRVISSNPNTTGSDNGVDLIITLKPNLLLPADGSTNIALMPVFSWSNVSCADSYRLLLSRHPSFAEQYNLLNITGINSTSYTVSQEILEDNQTYYWMVKSIDNIIGESEWATTYSFSTMLNPRKAINLTLSMQGLYNSNTGVHSPAYVSVELRSGSTLMSSTLIKRKPAFVEANSIVNVDFGDVTDGNYWLVVRASGYLPLAVPNQINLSTAGYSWNFTTSSAQSVGTTNAMIQPVNPGRWLMRSGDFNNSRSVTATDANIFLMNSGSNISTQIPAP